MPVVIGGLILSFLVMLLFGGTEIDRGLLLLLAGSKSPAVEQVAKILVGAATPTPLLAAVLLAAFYLFARSRWREGLLLLAVALAGRLLVDALQELTLGLRPEVNERLLPSQQPGYPSGHAANATITAVALGFLAARYQPTRTVALGLAASFALSVGLARVVLGASWPSDVIGGWALGLGWTLLLLRIAGEDLGDGTVRPVRHSPSDGGPGPPRGETYGESQDRDGPPDGRQRADRESGGGAGL